MGYDNSSLVGDEICDYYYDLENNLINPPSSTGFFIYKVVGGCFDWLNDLVTQFRNDYSILDFNIGKVEIVKAFPSEYDLTHVYYVPFAPSETGEARWVKYYFDGSRWVGEIFTGDVVNSLDVFWGRSYDLLRPSINHSSLLVFRDRGILSDYDDSLYSTTKYFERTDIGTKFNVERNKSASVRIGEPISEDFELNIHFNNIVRAKVALVNENQTQYAASSYEDDSSGRIHISGVGSYTIRKVGDTLTVEKNGKLVRSITITGETFTIWLMLSNSGYSNPEMFRFTKLELFLLDTKATYPLTDEEYKRYLYLKNHQLLTMKDLLTAFTNAFGEAKLTTTLLNSIHTVDHKTYDNPQYENTTLSAIDPDDNDIITNHLTDKEGVNTINDRLAQGTLTIQIPDQNWDNNYLEFLETFISIKGNILITQGDQ